MENISLKMEKEFLKAIEAAMKKHNYMTKTEFIREAIREKLRILEKPEAKKENQIPQEKKLREVPSYI